MWPRVFSHPFPGRQVNTVVFQVVSVCVIFFSAILSYLGKSKLKSFNLILNRFVQGTSFAPKASVGPFAWWWNYRIVVVMMEQ